MFALESPHETRVVTAAALASCIYLPSIISVVSYFGQLYAIGKRSSSYVLFLIFVAEFLKIVYLNRAYVGDVKRRGKLLKSRASDTVKCIVLCLCAVVAFFVAIILFGGPALDNHEETAMLSVLLTLMSVFPLARYVGVESCLQLLCGVKTTAGDGATAMLLRNATLTVCGSWLGAVVIPLDWHRPWQVWPIPCYLGALGGYLFSNVLTVIHNLSPLWFRKWINTNIVAFM